ncbi:MAG: LON peptidase substrate-binding domain-containing protein [Planctomycetota bacterium]|jgi:Lon protease-like protein
MSRLLPIFPLPNLILYPGSLVPLHLFEPRYLQLMEDMLAAGEKEMLAGTFLPGWQDGYFGEPDLYPISGLGHVDQVQKDKAGNFNLVLRGIQRVRIVAEPEMPSPTSRPYRKVEIENLEEPTVEGAEAQEHSKAILQALESLSGSSTSFAADLSLNYLTDVLLVQLPLEMQEKLDLFALCDPRARADSVLGAWKRFAQRISPPPMEPGPGFTPDLN